MTVLHLFLDFETRSLCDLKKHGLDRYAKDPSTEVLMLAYAINEQPPLLWLPPDPMPEQLKMMLTRKEIIKIAWEAEFERTIFREVLKIDIPVDQWIDPKVMARYASMSGGLETVGKIIGLGEGEAKLGVGKKLIKRFSLPKPPKRQPKPKQ